MSGYERQGVLRHLATVADLEGETLICEFEVSNWPAELKAAELFDLDLKLVIFADGVEVERDSDHARAVALNYGDPNFERHLDWPAIEAACLSEYAAGRSCPATMEAAA